MKKSNSIVAWGLGAMVAAWMGSAFAVDPVPDWATLIFPSMVPKAGHPNRIPGDLQTGLIRHAYQTRFENYWKEVSYFDYNRSTGQKIRGAYTNTKTYGYIEMPWPLAPRESQGEFHRGTGLGDIFRPERHEGAVPDGAIDPASGTEGTPRRRHSQLAFSSPHYAFFYDDADFDEVWTPGESFQDSTGDGQWTPPLPAEDFYDLNGDGTWDVAGGERFADFNDDGTFSPQVQVWLYNGNAGTNDLVTLDEFIQPSDGEHHLVFDPNMVYPFFPGDPRLPAEAVVTLDADGNMESVVIPANNKFDYTTTADDVPQFTLVDDVLQDYPVGASEAYVITTAAGEARDYYYYEDVVRARGPYVDDDGNPRPDVQRRTIRARVYAAAELYSAYKSSTPATNVFGDLRGPDAPERRVIDPEDGRPSPARAGDLFEDFLSYYDPERGGHVFVQRPPLGHPDEHLRDNISPLRGNALPNGSINVRGRPFSVTWDEYKAYIRWNYPGDAEALIARAFNGRHDGPDEWQTRVEGVSGKWRIDHDEPFEDAGTLPPIPATVNPSTGGLHWPSSNPGGGWDPRSGFATWEAWYNQVFGAGSPGWAPAWNATIPTIERYTADSGPDEDGWYPATSWGYQSPAEYCDLPSSIYHLRGSYAAGATLAWQEPGGGNPYTDFSPANALFMPGGDRRLGEVTSPWNEDVWGHDIESWADWYGPGNEWIPSAGPYAFNTIGGHGYDGANLATMELMTHRRFGVPGVDRHPRHFRDTNLDGYLDGGYELQGDANYSTDQIGVAGFGQYGEFTWYRYMEDVIALWDQSEDFKAIYDRVNPATPSARRLYAYPIYPVSPGNEGWAALSGPAGQVLDFISRGTGNPMHLTFQVRPMNAGGEGPGMGPGGGAPDPDWDPNVNPAVQDFGMALLAHEQGHDLMGWPDLYDYDSWSGGNPIYNNPIGGYDLMAGGGLVHGVPVLKQQAAIGGGWITPRNLATLIPEGAGPVELELYPVEYYRNQYYRLSNPGAPGEFYDIWFTDNDTEYGVVGGRGVYVSYTDLGSNPNALPIQQKVNNRFTYEMIQADGRTDLQDNINNGDAGDPFPGTRNMRTWSAHTLPAARWWNQTDIGLRILNIEMPAPGTRLPARVTLDRYDITQPMQFPMEGAADTDGDGIPDVWEFYYFGNLTTASATSDFSGNGVPDLYAFLAGMDPRKQDSNYDVLSEPGGKTWAELFDDGDGMPYGWEIQYPGYLDPYVFDAFDDPDMDGWDNLSEFLAGTDPSDPASFPRPQVGVRVDWAGAVSGVVRWAAWDDRLMDGPPMVSGIVTPGVGNGVLTVTGGAFRQGDAYLFVYMDQNNDGAWNPGEPAGFPDMFPLNVTWGSVPDVRVGLTLNPPGYRRLFWEAVSGVSEYQIRIRRKTSSGMPIIFDRTVTGRRYIHEADLRFDPRHAMGMEADSLTPEYEWYVNGVSQGVFVSDWTPTLAVPTLVGPKGVLRYQGANFVWSMPTQSTRYEVEIRPGSATNTPIYSGWKAAPAPGTDGRYAFRIPASLSLVQGQTYYWRARSGTPSRTGEWSAFSSFTVDWTSRAAGPYRISGDLWYMGRANIAPIIVQVFRSSSFGGAPFAQIELGGAGNWSVRGLPAGTYYLRAFMDINGNGVYDTFEPYGLIREPNPYALVYAPKAITVGPDARGHRIIVRDVDADNDGYSDAWECQQYGSLDVVQQGDVVPYAPHSIEVGTAYGTPVAMNVNLAALPAVGGTVIGGGAYFIGDTITATATAHPGYAFLAWMEGGTAVSTSRAYTFVGLGNRSLVARFVESANAHPFGVYHAQLGTWGLLNPMSGAPSTAQWGWSEAIPVPGDYDGDGIEDVAVYHPASGTWLIHESSTGQQRVVSWGWSEAIPVPADYDGDGRTDIAVYHPGTGTWLIWESAAQQVRTATWGWSEAIPVPGDYDGDGMTDIAVYHPATGAWHIWQSASQTPRSATWGWSEAVPVPGDYDGDGVTDIAVYHPATGAWHIWQSASQTPRSAVWGWPEAIPVPGDYDGDGSTDIAVYHPPSGNWYVWQSGTQTGRMQIWGWSEALPTSRQFWINRAFQP